MSDKQQKFSFFKTLKNIIDNTEEHAEENDVQETQQNAATENKQQAMPIKSVVAATNNNEQENFKGISTATDLDVQFAENFVHSGGKFIYTENKDELFNYLHSLKEECKWNHIFPVGNKTRNFMTTHSFQNEEQNIAIGSADAAISFCYSLSAAEGVIILSPEQATNRRLVNFPKNHIIIAFKNQLKGNISEAIEGFAEKFNDRIPSVLELYENKPVAKSNHRTLLSAEGPKNVFLFYIDQDLEN